MELTRKSIQEQREAFLQAGYRLRNLTMIR